MQNTQQLVSEILDLLLQYRRSYDDKVTCAGQHAAHCFPIQRDKLQQLIEQRLPIKFVLPAFPAKSPNTNKTETSMPDLGERLSLRFLNQLCAQIHARYAPGVEMIICSDGRVFNDLVLVTDGDVNAYAHGIRSILAEDALSYLTTFALDDYYCNMPYAAMRAELVNEYGDSLLTLKARIKNNPQEKMLFNGIHRFIYEDQLSKLTTASNNKIREMTKAVAYEVVRRSNAWSRFVERHFPDAMRLSIHPQVCGSEKFGIMLLKSKDVWATPWHRVVLYDGKEHLLIRKNDALMLGAKPVYNRLQFSHYAM